MSPAEKPEPDAAMIRTKDLVKVHHSDGTDVHAIRGIDLRVRPGEFVAVMGPSGSGKSTVLHLLAGLVPATSGEIWVRGNRLSDLSEADRAVLRRRHIGVVFQFFNLISNMSVADNVELPALLAGANPKQARERREYLLEELGLSDRADASPARLSGGQQQRVALARALSNEPSLLLADEPTGNLDSTNTRDVVRLLEQVHDQGQTILLVTHDARVASSADRVISLFDGMIVDDADVRPPTDSKNAIGSILDL
ncbi:ABC transporter ATP-binding protein [Actinoallomurus iriomotensis]|uniref:ABC transporter ATP-binding protein n=1 Tax=Actinoallomurus iriomotensis TaxID=478107 RepID=A0A9W6RF32_9ACTN|nr:ABC transporter ATP-binding protein [Actinoallomurus iriomotensis]GLY74696.1 ABC transporter ATP-binding protein [Actinoallomurus iriomotensis]GLY83695.1 ABC transporter ATP-binding protein [Actinoallomurus iriomotensis]